MVIENFSLNIKLFRAINNAHSKIFDDFFYGISGFGSGFLLIPFSFYLYSFKKEKLRPFLIALVLETLLVVFLKNTLNQPRPATLLKDVHLLIKLYWGSFPSGDVAMAAVIGFFLWDKSLFSKILAVLYVLLISYERVYNGVHFPLDVVAGLLIGIFSGFFGKKLYEKVR